jgi:hypothetical protein
MRQFTLDPADAPVATLGEGDSLDCQEVAPGFSMAVSALFL